MKNEIRLVALGRKSYLFCGLHGAAQRTAMLYGLLGTCRLHGVNHPFIWLKNVLRIAAHPVPDCRTGGRSYRHKLLTSDTQDVLARWAPLTALQ